MKLAELKWPDVEALSKDTPIIIPIAAHEQHGVHLPLHTDSLLLGEIVRRTEEHLGNDALFAPLTWLGNSHHHMDFPGTLSADPRVYLDLLNGLLEDFIQHGFKRLVLLNGHGGNKRENLEPKCPELFARFDAMGVVYITYWLTCPESFYDQHLELEKGAGHAGEFETSFAMLAFPERIRRDEINYDNDPQWIFESEGAIRAAEAAREAGKVRWIGFTGHKHPQILARMLSQDFPWDTCQMPVNVLDAHYRSFQRLSLIHI